MADFAPIFAGWNAWSVYQKNDLDFEAMMIGLDRDRRLRIWVEDAAKESPESNIDDPIALKGSQVQIVQTDMPKDLRVAAQREKLSGPLLTLDGPSQLRTVRFFNRGKPGNIPWPHDSNYLLEAVFEPSATSPVTSGAPPEHYIDAAADVGAKAAVGIVELAAVGVGGYFLWKWLTNRKPRRVADDY